MQLHSLVDPIYFPEANQQSVLRLGLRKLTLAEWLHMDADFLQFQQHKLQQGTLRKEKVFMQLASSINAQAEFSRFLKDYLLDHWPNQFRVAGDQLIYLPTQTSWTAQTQSLWDSSLWIQDDICLLEKDADQYVMTAASLCSPSNWMLEEKIGRSIDWIHAPVPGYQQALADRVNKLLDALKPLQPVLRFNWSIQRGNELCWREDVESQNAAHIFWRVERQTLLRLPDSGAIVFAIRLFLHSVETMKQSRKFGNDLLALLNRQSDDIKHYKGLDAALLEQLQRELLRREL